MNKFIITTGTLAAMAVAQIALAPQAFAGDGHHGRDNHKKVTICHSTGSQKNPYVKITVSKWAILKQGHDIHEGPVFDGIQKGWGDIIPAFTKHDQSYPGYNWDTAGKAIYENNCEAPQVEDDCPDEPVKPEKPKEPECPDEPEQPKEPECPDEPEEPQEPEQPQEPEEPQTPDEPETPSEPTPEEPQTPSEPTTPPTQGTLGTSTTAVETLPATGDTGVTSTAIAAIVAAVAAGLSYAIRGIITKRS